jgi:hypothetical protein
MLGRKNLDAPRAVEADLAHGVSEADDILGALTDERAAVKCVFKQRPDNVNSHVAEFDTEDEVWVETCHEFRKRCVGAKDVPRGRRAIRPTNGRQLGSVRRLGHLPDEIERKRFDCDAGAGRCCFVGDPAKRFDERCEVVDGISECSSYFDERCTESAGRFEQQFPGAAPREVVRPPAGEKFDLDVLQAGGLDLGPESGEADRLPNNVQITMRETDARPAVEAAARTRSIAENGLTSGPSRGATLPALVQQVAMSVGVLMRSGRRRRRHLRRPNERRRRRG